MRFLVSFVSQNPQEKIFLRIRYKRINPFRFRILTEKGDSLIRGYTLNHK